MLAEPLDSGVEEILGRPQRICRQGILTAIHVRGQCGLCGQSEVEHWKR